MIEPLVVSVEETKRHLGGVSTATVYRLMAKGDLQKKKIGARTAITWASIRALLDTPEAA